ncbi:MAG: ATP-binding protein [Proteobacteria bacterium]|nr:ATP-binding protein [Pseudomonadota bacterium]
MTFTRPVYKVVFTRVKEPRKFIQVIAGPRQVGKTTLIKKLLSEIKIPTHYASADLPTLQDIPWIEQQWEIGRHKAKAANNSALLVLDEIQKIPNWSEKVKSLWDQDSFDDIPLKVVILGSSPLLIQRGLTESLAGRFETIHMTHWSYEEMKDAFGWDLNQYIYFGGYPGSADLIRDELRWQDYINQSLIETSISRDILLMTRVDKPALLRRVFELGCFYSSQILSYQKMLGQLSDAGNATTLAHYLTLLSGAGMLTGLNKFSGKIVLQKASSPKFQVYNTALMSAQKQKSYQIALEDQPYWGRLVESAVGAFLINESLKYKFEVFYWRERNKEVDFILQKGDKIIAIEVKSGLNNKATSGSLDFQKKYHPNKMLLIGKGGIALEDFFCTHIEHWFN